jgi:hypothetical protein
MRERESCVSNPLDGTGWAMWAIECNCSAYDAVEVKT